MSLLTRRLCQPCCDVTSVSITAVRTVRRRAARVVVDGSSHNNTHVPDDLSVFSSSPSPSSTSPSSTTTASSPSTYSPTISPSLTSSLSSPSSSSLSLTSPSPHTLAQPRFPKAVFGLTEMKLRELAASMPPVLPRRENVVQLPTPPEPEVKKSPMVTEENLERVLASLYTPLWRLPYAEQLQHKEKKAGICLRELKKRICDVYSLPLPEQLPRLPCPLNPILAAPSEQGYRNEDTFTVWRGLDGNPKTVGLLTGGTKTEGTVCLSPSSLITVREKHKLFCQAFQDFIRCSPHPSFIDYHNSRGVWRSVTVRTTDAGDTLASVSVFPHLLDTRSVAAIEGELEEYFTTGPGAAVGLTSLYLQVSDTTHKCRHKAPYRHLFGPPHLLHTCAGVACRVLPDTALPVNVSAEETLISIILRVTGMTADTNVLFVGAGSGHLCLPLARSVRRVVCVESAASAADDANANIALNSIQNVTFTHGPYVKVLPKIVKDLKSAENVVAVVNCGDKGLHPQVVVHLRRTLSMSQLLLLTTNPDGFVMANCASFANMLDRNKLAKYPPMLPVLALTADVAPHAPQFMLGLLLTRDEYEDVSPHRR